MTRIRTWRRLEPRSRAEQTDPAAWIESLRARLHDPAWSIARQLQVGEFEGEDAGNAVIADVRLTSTPLDRVVLGHRADAAGSAPPQSLSGVGVPLEALVEREEIPMTDETRVRLGRYFETKLGDPELVRVTRLVFPLRPSASEDGEILQSDESLLFRDSVAGRVTDGGEVVRRLESGESGDEAYERAREGLMQAPDDDIVRLSGALTTVAAAALRAAASALVAWYRQRLHPKTVANRSWDDARLEYGFSVSATASSGREFVLDAAQYYQGEVDWYAFTLASATTLGPRAGGDITPQVEPQRAIAIPGPVEFAGMPAARWWDFEDRQVNFGSVDVQKTELAKLLILDFALSQSVNWLLIPVQTTWGSIVQVESLHVWDTFGVMQRVGPAADAQEGWTLYSLTRQGSLAGEADFDPNLLLLPPSLPRIQESAPIEEVLFLRDEMANMAWAVERTVTDDLGRVTDGHDLSVLPSRRRRERALRAAQRAIDEWRSAQEFLDTVRRREASENLLRLAEQAQESARSTRDQYVAQYIDGGGDVRDLDDVERPALAMDASQYRLFSAVPANWIPFVPVPVPGRPANMRLRRHAIPDLDDVRDGVPQRIRARGRVLQPEKRPYNIFEEEVPRGGVRVVRTKQYVRDAEGRAHFWIGRRKRPGKGEGSSALRFDFLRQP